MTCTEVRQWLDDGHPKRAGMMEHVAGCAACGPEYHAAVELDRLLAVVVTLEGRASDGPPAEVRPALVLDVIAQPVVPVSIAVAIVLGVVHEPLASAIAGWTTSLAAAPLLLWSSWQLYVLFRRMTLPDV